MSSAANRLPNRGREAFFDVTAIRKIISDLLVHTADEVESPEIEIKGWCSSERELAEKVSEACSCIANTAGGYVIVGVEDGPRWQRFSRCPHPSVTKNWLITSVHNSTKPPVDCSVYDATEL